MKKLIIFLFMILMPSICSAGTLCISGDDTFESGDILRIKDSLDDEWMLITDAGSAPTYTVTRDLDEQYASGSNPIWKKGTSVTNFGQSGDGLIFFTASEPTAPYLSVVTHAGAPYDTLTTHMRLGNLNGYLDYATDLYGIAIGESDAYLKYDPTNGLRIKGIITAESGSSTGTSNQLLRNGNFEVWSAGTSSAPDGWTLEAGMTIARESSTIKIGTYSAKVTSDADGGYLYQPILTNLLPGKPYTFSCWVWASDASNARLRLTAIGTPGNLTEYSSYHTGGSSWELLTVTITTPVTTVTQLQAYLYLDGNVKIAYFDGAMLVEGSVAQPYAPKNYSEQFIHPSDTTKIDGGTIYTNTVVVAGLNADATDRMFADATTKTNIEAWKHVSDVTKIDGEDIYTGTVTADKITAGTYVGGNFVIGAGGAFQSDNYVADTSGFRLNHEALELNAGTTVLGEGILETIMIYSMMFGGD